RDWSSDVCSSDYYQVFVDAEYLSKALACTAGSVRVVETKEIDRGLGESHSVAFEAIGKAHRIIALGVHDAFAIAFVESCLYGIGQAKCRVLVVGGYDGPVDKYLDAVYRFFLF